MKKVILMLFFIAIPNVLTADDPGNMEILIETINMGEYDNYKFEIKPAIGKTTWCWDEKWKIVTNATTSSDSIDDDNCGTDYYGFQVCYHAPTYPPFWVTLNKFTIYKENASHQWEQVIYFYIDFRDCRYGSGPGGGSNDISILVDADDDKVYYDGGLDQSCSLLLHTEITETEILNIWDVNNYGGSHDISCFCPTPVLESITEYNNRPKITWRHEDDSNGSYIYEVWRLLANNFFKIPIGTWYLINTVTDTTYVDNEIYIGDESWGRAWYKIRAKIDDLYSGYSNYKYIEFQGIDKPIVKNSDVVEITEFKLHTNYPNPFNPNTKISFDILEKSPVELAVYDIQGKKVVTLVNETLEKGNYSIEFNAGNLPSGTYLYKIVAGEFTDTKRMLLLK